MSDSAGTIGKCPACKVEGVKLKDIDGLLICEKCSSKRFSSKVRKRIQEAYERQEDAKRKQAWVARMDIARRGVKHFGTGKLPEALRCFKDYLTILESRYNVMSGGLQASLFDKKKDAGEVLLIAGVYWDMAKIYDHMKGHQRELRVSLNKFIEFSIGRNHLILASEAIRRYLASNSIKNVQDFKDAQHIVHQNLPKCFIATAVFGPASREVEVLRNIRDQVLEPKAAGRAFISAYYRISPPIAVLFAKRPLIAAVARFALKPLTGVLIRLHQSSASE